MALMGFDQLSTNKTLTPDSDAGRLNRISANRSLLNGNFNELQVPYLDSAKRIKPLTINWFRRAAEFYPEFMLSRTPIVTTGNALLDTFLEGLGQRLWDQVGFTNVDLLAFGEGVLFSHPTNPISFIRVDPAQWFEVRDADGDLMGDVFYEIRERNITDPEVDIYRYPIGGRAQRYIHAYQSGSIGPVRKVIDLPDRASLFRQAVPYPLDVGFSAGQSRSIFDDMKSSIGELSRTATSLAQTIRRNSRPHLFGPEGSIRVDAQGNAEIDVNGMFIPVPEGDSPPGYLQWDSSIEAIQFAWEQHLENALIGAGLNKLLFDPEKLGQVASGTALRRLMLPFLAKVQSLQESNQLGFLAILQLIVANNGAAGGEIYGYDDAAVEIEWGFRDIFEDVVEEGGSEDE